jgi:DNA-directed RNA polymerase subunit RPC12/RpoP
VGGILNSDLRIPNSPRGVTALNSGENVPPARRKVLTGLTCASCGGTVDVHEGLTNVECQYCHTSQAIVGERGVIRVMVLNRLEREKASDVVRRWFRRGIRKDPALKREAHFLEAFLAWFPFVRAKLDAVGWVLGIREKKRRRGNRWETVREPVERQVESALDLTMPAADMAEFGVHRVSLTLRSRGMVFRPSRSLEEAAAALGERALENIKRENRLDHVSFSWFAAVRRRVALVYYPMWVVRYGFRGQTYQVLIDAEDGSLAFGKAPGNHLYRAFSLVAACASACFVGTTILQHAGQFLRSENGLMGLGMIGLALAGLVYWGYSQFRHGGVVEEGSGLARDREHQDLVATVKNVVEKFQ